MNLKGLHNAWITPYGEYIDYHPDFYGDSGGWHNQLAEKLIADETGHHDYYELTKYLKNAGFDYAYDYLESKGWIRLHSFAGLPPKFIKTKRSFTADQKSAILDWCIANDVKYNDCVIK